MKKTIYGETVTRKASVPAILIIPLKHFPCDHAMLESIYTRLLPERDYHVTWLMLSDTVTRRGWTTWNGTAVCLFPVRAARGLKGYLRAIIAWFRLLAFAVILTWRKRFDIIQVRNAVTAGCVAWLVARIRNAKFVYQYSFPIPESLIQAAREGRTRIPWLQIWHGRLQIVVRTWILRHADLVLAISDEMRREVVSQRVSPDRVVSLPLGTDCPSAPDVARIETERRNLGLNGHPTVLYLGAIDGSRQLDFLIRVAKTVKDELPEARWIFVGGGNNEEIARLRSMAVELNVFDIIHFVGQVPRNTVNTYISLANVSVSPIPPTALFRMASPTKTIESLACGCPVVGTDIPDQADVLETSGGGLVVPFREQEYAQAIIHLLRNPAMANAMGTRGRDYARTHRSYDLLAKSIHEQYSVLLRTA